MNFDFKALIAFKYNEITFDYAVFDVFCFYIVHSLKFYYIKVLFYARINEVLNTRSR